MMLRDQFEVRHPRKRDADFPPAMNRRNRRFDQLGDGTGSTEGVDDLACFCFHATQDAIIAFTMQGKSCDLGNCFARPYRFLDGMDMDEIRALIKQRRAEGKERYTALAKLLDIDPTKFSKSVNGIREFTVAEMDTLRRYFGVKIEPETIPNRRLPVVGLVSAGQWSEGFEIVMDWIPSPDPALSDKAFVVIVDGDSMDKVAKAGDRIIIEPTDKRLRPGKMYVVRNSNGETTFKCYQDNPARLEPLSNNESHQTIYPGEDGFEVIGRATMKVTGL